MFCFMGALKEFIINQVLHLIDGLCSHPARAVSHRIDEGRPADKIVEAAKEGGFDLIVMGIRGLGAVEEFFLGSVTDRAADTAVCPVAIVK
jgi:nucleotide-binding universal stress UspA family protein